MPPFVHVPSPVRGAPGPSRGGGAGGVGRAADPPGALLVDVAATLPGERWMGFATGPLVADVLRRRASAAHWMTERHVRRASEAGALHGHGAIPIAVGERADVVAIRLPTDRLSQRQLLADAFDRLAPGGHCLVAGATDEGVKPAIRMMAEWFGAVEVRGVRAGCRAAVAVKRAEQPADPAARAHPLLDHDAFHVITATLRGRPVALHTRPGVFSWEHLDEATALLADVLEVPAGASVLDLGCGGGALGVAAWMAGAGAVTLVDADSEAVRAARRTVDAAGVPHATVLASDVGDAVRTERFDVVVTNPPFHAGKATDLSLPERFLRDSWALLRPGGRLYVVANRTLPYEAMLADGFGGHRVRYDGRRFKVLVAERTS